MDGELFTGKIRVNPRRRHEAYVSVEGFPPTADVKLEGFRAQNRVIEGDVVVIRLDDVSAWPGLDDRGGGASGERNRRRRRGGASGGGGGGGGGGGASPPPDSPSTAVEDEDGWDDAEDDGAGDDDVDDGVDDGVDDDVVQSEDEDDDVAEASKFAMKARERERAEDAIRRALRAASMDAPPPRRPPSLETLADAAARGGPGGTPLRPTGRVVAVLEKSPKRDVVIGYVDVVDVEGGGGGKTSPKFAGNVPMLRLHPVDARLPFMSVEMSPKLLPPEIASQARERGLGKLKNALVSAKITRWSAGAVYPHAALIEILGEANALETVTAALIAEHAILGPDDFSADAIACLPEVPDRSERRAMGGAERGASDAEGFHEGPRGVHRPADRARFRRRAPRDDARRRRPRRRRAHRGRVALRDAEQRAG